MAKTDVEAQIILDLPNRPAQCGNRARFSDLVLVEHLDNWPHWPFDGALDDGTQEQIGMLVAREGRGQIEMNGAPFPALGDESPPSLHQTRAGR